MFFASYPTTKYNGITARNLMLGVRILPEVFANYTTHYPYSVREGDSITSIAYDYYGSVDYAWLVLLSSKIMDPYYEFPMPLDAFAGYIALKYGSLQEAYEKIVGYRRVEVTGEISSLSVEQQAEFNQTLTDKYGSPEAAGETVLFYQASLNGDRVTPETWANLPSNQQTAYGPVYADQFEENIYIEYVNRDATKTSMYLMTPFTYQTLPPSQRQGFRPVYAYNYETQLNDRRRLIKLISKKYALDIQTELREKLNNATR